jgi:hypothetical protein
MSSSYAQQITPASGAKVVTGSNLKNLVESGATLLDVGGSLTTKNVDLTNSQVTNGGSLTIGETGLGSLFADTIRSVTEQNTNALSALVSGSTRPSLPNAASDLPNASGDMPGDAATTSVVPWLKSNWWWLTGLAALGLWFWKRK